MSRTLAWPLARLIAFVAFVALSAALSGCHSAFTAAAPRGFVELDAAATRYDYRATNADGLVVAARELDNDPHAELAFWARAVQNAMRSRGGYALIDTRDVQIAGGLPAKQLRFGHDEGTRPHLYYVTIAATCDTIYVLEAGGDKTLVEQHQPELDSFVHAFKAERCAPFPFSFACSAVTGGKATPVATTNK